MIDLQLYWSIRGPQLFVESVKYFVSKNRCIIINTPTAKKDLALAGIARAFSGYITEHFISLEIDSGTDVSRTIGYHFGEKILIPEGLAVLRSELDYVFLLNPVTDSARRHCLEYVEAFQKSIDKNVGSGNSSIILSLHSEEFVKSNVNGLVNFDGGISADEMHAYAILHTLDRLGPGSTNLIRELIIAYSGNDVFFFHELLQLNDTDILNIDSFAEDKLAKETDVWRHNSWLKGTYSLVGDSNHFLRNFYLSRYGEKRTKKHALKKMELITWRVCLRVIIPWLEERRPKTIELLKNCLLNHDFANPSTNEVKVKIRDAFVYLPIEDIEYNAVAGLCSYENLRPSSDSERLAVDFCFRAKRIRDDIAHLRAPSISRIISIVTLGDSLFR